MILDSGTRREFETGAVRDIQEGKGRCDLLPLDIVGTYYCDYCDEAFGKVLILLSGYQETGDVEYLYRTITKFAEISSFHTLSEMFLEVSKHYSEGAKKYSPDNWKKGIPTHCYIDSAVRHYFKWMRCDADEPHDRAFLWNVLCAAWTSENKPELNDYGKVSKD